MRERARTVSPLSHIRGLVVLRDGGGGAEGGEEEEEEEERAASGVLSVAADKTYQRARATLVNTSSRVGSPPRERQTSFVLVTLPSAGGCVGEIHV